MKKNKLRVLEIRGFRGLLLSLFVVSCLIAGFIAFPAFLAMNVWNYFSNKTLLFPSTSFVGGLLLWGIAVVTFLITRKKKKFLISFASPQELTETEVQQVLTKIKTQNNSSSIIISDFERSEDEKSQELTSVPANKNETK